MVKLLLLPLMGVLLLSYSGGYGLSLPDKSNGNSVHGKSVTLAFRDATEKFARESLGLHSAQSKENDFPADGGVLGSVVEGSDSLLHETRVDEGENDDSSELDDLFDDDSSELDDLFDDDIVDNFANIPFEDLSDEDLEELLALDDEIFLGEADEHEALKLLLEEHVHPLYAPGTNSLRRKKRFIPLLAGVLGRVALGATRAISTVGRVAIPRAVAQPAFNTAARSFFRGVTRNGLTRSGQRLTRHYTRPGDYNRALQDFRGFRLDNVKPIGGSNGISGQTGTMGNLKFTVRNGSSARSGNRPTLEVRSHEGTLVRKVRYD
ncbi:uncharacterized protein [Littorina saxatilis]|uniref:uncharacterized protein n=1 Tax=Littorina saxatilis TaxID=31220 RepID=UPI0038B42CCB